MIRYFRKMTLYYFIVMNCGCTTTQVTFIASSERSVITASLMKLDVEGESSEEVLGPLPVTLESSRLEGRILRFRNANGAEQYWIAPEFIGEKITAKVQLDTDEGQSLRSEKGATYRNRVVRLLLQAYKALSGKRFDAAIQLAEQAAILDPEISGPQLIKALAQLSQGDKTQARISIEKARALDPEDQSLAKLIEIVE